MVNKSYNVVGYTNIVKNTHKNIYAFNPNYTS